MFFVIAGFITFAFILGYEYGLFLGRKFAKMSTNYTMQMLTPHLPKDFDMVKALDEFEIVLKKRGELPHDYKHKE